MDGKLYVVTPEHGLNVVEHDTLRPLPGTERLVNEPFPVVLSYDASRLLVGTRNDGLFLYDGATLTPFPTELDAIFKEGQLYRGTALPDGTFALSSTSVGMSGDCRNWVVTSSVSTVDQCTGRRLRWRSTRRAQSSSPCPAGPEAR